MNMELDQLKQMWQEQEPRTTRGLSDIIGKRSNSPIAKMKRNLILELVVVVISFGSIVLYYLSEFQGRFQLISWFYGIIGLLFLVYFFFKYRLLHEMECMACQVKSNLSKQVSTLEKFTKLYLWAGTALMPLVMAFFYFYLNQNLPERSGPRVAVFSPLSLALFLFITLVVTVPMYFLNKWYIRKLYGRQIERLKEMLEQMEQH